MGYKLGRLAETYYAVGGITVGANVLATTMKDVDIDDSRDKIEIGTRGTGEFKAYAPGRRDVTISFNIQKDQADAFYTALSDAYNDAAANVIGIQIWDAPAADGGAGFEMDFMVSKFKEGQELDGVVMIDVEICPTYPANYSRFRKQQT